MSIIMSRRWWYKKSLEIIFKCNHHQCFEYRSAIIMGMIINSKCNSQNMYNYVVIITSIIMYKSYDLDIYQWKYCTTKHRNNLVVFSIMMLIKWKLWSRSKYKQRVKQQWALIVTERCPVQSAGTKMFYICNPGLISHC